MTPRDEGQIKDLAEKLRSGELTRKEALKGLKERGLVEQERWEIILWVIYFILWLPVNFLFSEQLPVISFPPSVIYISIIIVLLGIILCVWATYPHYKRGGLQHDETIKLFKEGPYRVIRHPAGFGFMMLPILLPVILSSLVPFTFLSIAAIIVMVVYLYYGVLMEEKELDIPKWGDDYRQYMKEVPRFNFIIGLCRLRKRRK